MMTRFPFPITPKAFELLDKGFMYVCGRDRLFRPIMILNYGVPQTTPPPQVDDVVGAAMITVLFVNKYMLKDGVVENLLQVGNNAGTSLFTMQYSLIKGVLGFMTAINRGRARMVAQINAPQTISVIWNTVRYFVDENKQ